jgi:predicted transcriptional regulator
MDAALTKRNQSFRLSVDLIDRLKLMAKRQNRSLNNFVETLLLDVAYNEPNAETLAAMEEARSGNLRDVPEIDTSSVEAMVKSMGL